MNTHLFDDDEDEPGEETKRGDRRRWEEYRTTIDKKLGEVRPPRAAVGEKDWREPVYGWARNHIPDESNLVRKFAEEVVDGRERHATTQGNKYLRGWLHGLMPLDWKLIGPYPVRVGKLRIRLDVVTPDELEDAERELRSVGQNTYNEVLLLCQGMLDLARLARRQGHATVAKVGDQEAREQPQPGPRPPFQAGTRTQAAPPPA